MNFVHGRIQGGRFVTASGMTLPLGRAPSASEGRPSVYGIRPEHMHLSDEGLPVEVVVVEPTGSETQVVTKSGDHEIICVFRERIRARPGETIRIMPDTGATHLFDPEGGRRLIA
jgi:multiple sugar transport system ATP-binding protein